jgi:hypothetical protein
MPPLYFNSYSCLLRDKAGWGGGEGGPRGVQVQYNVKIQPTGYRQQNIYVLSCFRWKKHNRTVSYISSVYRLCFGHENQLISCSTQSMYLKTTPTSVLIQNKLRSASLGTDRIENERFGLVFAKTIIFTSKTGSINSGTVLLRLSLAGNLKNHFCPSMGPNGGIVAMDSGNNY